MSEQHTAGRSDLYPSYLVSVANCIIVCLLAVFWMSFEWLPFFVTYLSDIKETTGHIAAGYIEGATGYIVSGILWAIFGICVHHRKAQMSKKDFIRMEG
ncbi:hypothetical protein FRC19_004272 [Serendipita sp. 401]|nr:hypothetical protein FRC15_000353 [Serendipita sp. 397]KAG8823287.1 hypothetical protein FRC19_004272 [Serendipita sp. 401]KAG8869756.1 hypothetical protein FRC20_000891 [Serendipita sp. 405]